MVVGFWPWNVLWIMFLQFYIILWLKDWNVITNTVQTWINPLTNTTPLFLVKPPLKSANTVQAPLFRQSSLYISFCEPPLKVRFFSEPTNPPNQMKNTCPFYMLFQVLKLLLVKIFKMQPPDFLFLVVFISFNTSSSADIIFHNVLELHSTLIEKKIFVMNFPFITD